MIYPSNNMRSTNDSCCGNSTNNDGTMPRKGNFWRAGLLACALVVVLVSTWVPSHAQLEKSSKWSQERFGIPSAFDDALYHKPLPEQNACTPQRLHVAQASNVHPTSSKVNMTVSFTLPRPTSRLNCSQAKITVIYGRGTLFPDGHVSEGERLEFDYDASVRVPGLNHYHSDMLYHYVLPNLQAGLKDYWYRIVVQDVVHPDVLPPNLVSSSVHPRLLRGSLLGETPTYPLTTPPVAHQSTSLALVGDLGQTENSTKTMHHIFKATQQNPHAPSSVPPVSTVLIAGDLSYADGDPYRWERWLELMEPLLRSTPMASTPGNHEIECDNTTREVFGMYESYFRNPNRIQTDDRLPVDPEYKRSLWNHTCVMSSEFLGHYDYGNAFFSFQHGLAHIVVLNSYTETAPSSAQYQWLENELQNNVDRSVTPWLIVMFHAPFHTTFQNHVGEINPILMLEAMEPLLVHHGVNLVVSGHDHAYLRTTPMVGQRKDPTGQGPVYLTLGAGGNRELHTKGFIHDVPEEWVAKRDNSEYGYGHLYLANATHALFSWVRDGTTQEGVHDRVWFVNQQTLKSLS